MYSVESCTGNRGEHSTLAAGQSLRAPCFWLPYIECGVGQGRSIGLPITRLLPGYYQAISGLFTQMADFGFWFFSCIKPQLSKPSRSRLTPKKRIKKVSVRCSQRIISFYCHLILPRCSFFCHFTTVNSRSNLAWLHLKRAQSQAGLVAALHGMMTLEYPVTLLLRNPFSPITPRPHR